LAPDMLAS